MYSRVDISECILCRDELTVEGGRRRLVHPTCHLRRRFLKLKSPPSLLGWHDDMFHQIRVVDGWRLWFGADLACRRHVTGLRMFRALRVRMRPALATALLPVLSLIPMGRLRRRIPCLDLSASAVTRTTLLVPAARRVVPLGCMSSWIG